MGSNRDGRLAEVVGPLESPLKWILLWAPMALTLALMATPPIVYIIKRPPSRRRNYSTLFIVTIYVVN